MLIKPYEIIKRKLLLALSLFTLLLGFPVTALAGSIDNPTASLKKGSFAVGLELDLTSRDVKFSDKEIGERTRRYLMKGSYGLLDWVNLYGTVGAGSIQDDIGFKGDPGLAYGGGVKLRLYEYEDILFGLTGQFLRFTSHENDVAGINGLTLKSTWNEYDVALGASTKIAASSFYAGALFSKLDGELKTFSTNTQKAHFKESHPFGIFLGADAELMEQLRFGIEARLVNETSFSVKLIYAFGGPKQGAEKK